MFDARTEAQKDAEFVAYQRQVKAEMAASNECTRCNGKGKIRGFGHIEGGKCFACGGSGQRKPRREG